MRVLVTGGAGFIGSHLVSALLSKGFDVRVLDNLSTGSLDNLRDLLSDVDFCEGDVRDEQVVRRSAKGVSLVFHLAALPSVPRSIKDPVTSIDVNVLGTASVLKAASEEGANRLIYAASSSAYGDSEEASKAESLNPRPLSPYAVSKLAGEYLLRAFSLCYGLDSIGLRYFNVFGERQNPASPYSGVIAKFCKAMIEGNRPVVNGDGTISRDFTYVQNVVDGTMRAALSSKTFGGEIFNVACGGSITLLEVIDTINMLLGSHIEPHFGATRPGDVPFSRADIRKAQSVLGYEPTVGFLSGLRRTLMWYSDSLGIHTGRDRVYVSRHGCCG